jgi:hypothetical protein
MSEPLDELLNELHEWLDGHNDGAPDAPVWRRQAGAFAERLRMHLNRMGAMLRAAYQAERGAP